MKWCNHDVFFFFLLQFDLENVTESHIRELICDPEKLQGFLYLPPQLNINITELSEFMCEANETAAIIAIGIDLGKVLYKVSILVPVPVRDGAVSLPIHICHLKHSLISCCKIYTLNF